MLKTIARDELADNAATVGRTLLGALESLKQKHPTIGDVRGKGLAIGIELVSDRAGKAPAKRETAMTAFRAFELGLVLYYVGVNSNVLELTPPLTLTEAEALEGVSLLDRALTDVAGGRFDEAALRPFQGW